MNVPPQQSSTQSWWDGLEARVERRQRDEDQCRARQKRLALEEELQASWRRIFRQTDFAHE